MVFTVAKERVKRGLKRGLIALGKAPGQTPKFAPPPWCVYAVDLLRRPAQRKRGRVVSAGTHALLHLRAENLLPRSAAEPGPRFARFGLALNCLFSLSLCSTNKQTKKRKEKKERKEISFLFGKEIPSFCTGKAARAPFPPSLPPSARTLGLSPPKGPAKPCGCRSALTPPLRPLPRPARSKESLSVGTSLCTRCSSRVHRELAG